MDIDFWVLCQISAKISKFSWVFSGKNSLISENKIFNFHLRFRLHGSGIAPAKKPFMDQFPYKTCQRGYQTTRKRPMSLPHRPKSTAREDPGEKDTYSKAPS